MRLGEPLPLPPASGGRALRTGFANGQSKSIVHDVLAVVRQW